MKADRRHELQHNALADALGEWTEKLRPYARMIAGLVVIALVLAIAYGYVTGKNEQRAAEGWDMYFEALNSEDRTRMATVAETYAGTSVAPWARIMAADLALSQGCGLALQNKTESRELLRKAVDNYQSLVNDSNETIRQRALFGLGRAHESLGTVEDLNKAREDYEQVVKNWPEGIYAASARQRLEDLQRNSTKQFYDWLAAYEPPKATSPSGVKPDFLDDNLDGDIKLPSNFESLNPDLPGPAGDDAADPLDFLNQPTGEGTDSAPGKDAGTGDAPAGDAPASPETGDDASPAEPAAETPTERPAEGAGEPAAETPADATPQ